MNIVENYCHSMSIYVILQGCLPSFNRFKRCPLRYKPCPLADPSRGIRQGNDVELQKTGWKRLKIDANGHQIRSNPEIFSRADDGSKKSFEHSEKPVSVPKINGSAFGSAKKLERLPPHFFASLWDPNGFHGFHGFEQDLAPCEPCGESRESCEPREPFAQWKFPARLLVTGSISIHLSLGLQPQSLGGTSCGACRTQFHVAICCQSPKSTLARV